MLGLSASIVTSIHLKMKLNRGKDVSKGILFNPVKQFPLCGQQSCKFTATKENVFIRTKDFNSQRIGLGHLHGHRVNVLGHQNGCHYVM